MRSLLLFLPLSTWMDLICWEGGIESNLKRREQKIEKISINEGKALRGKP